MNTKTPYLTRKGDTYYYYRRVPKDLPDIYSWRFIRVSLKTSDVAIAAGRCTMANQATEAFWDALRNGNGERHKAVYDNAVKIAQSLGFDYRPMTDLIHGPLEDLVARTVEADSKPSPKVAEALLGSLERPTIRLHEAFDRFIEFKSDETRRFTETERKRWLNPRRKAIDSFTGFLKTMSIRICG